MFVEVCVLTAELAVLYFLLVERPKQLRQKRQLADLKALLVEAEACEASDGERAFELFRRASNRAYGGRTLDLAVVAIAGAARNARAASNPVIGRHYLSIAREIGLYSNFR